jgi:hypothetical protein
MVARGPLSRQQWPIVVGVAFLAVALACCQQGEPNSQGLVTFDLKDERPALTLFGGQAEDRLIAAAAGDVNGDGHQDIIVGAFNADGPADARSDCGEAYVIFGPADERQTIDIAEGQQDVTIFGADSGDLLGFALATADVNGDGVDDILVGAPWADGPDNERLNAGEAYVILGSPTLTPTIDIALGQQSLTLFGADEKDQLGTSLAGGDADGDGIDDMLVGSFLADGPENARYQGGEAYLVRGGPSLSGARDMAEGEYDLTIISAEEDDQLGYALTMADLNNDGIDDLVVAAFRADVPGKPGQDREDGGKVYVIVGTPTLEGVLDLATASASLTVVAADNEDDLGSALASGDVNGDGVDDVLIGAYRADGPDNARRDAGETYVVFGGSSLPSSVEIGRGEQDVTVLGADPGDRLGGALASVDIDGDGIDDIIVAVERADGPENERKDAGELYVVLGSPALEPTVDTALGEHSAAMFGAQRDDAFGWSVAATDWDNDGRADILAVARAADGPEGTREDAGQAYVIPIGSRLNGAH